MSDNHFHKDSESDSFVTTKRNCLKLYPYINEEGAEALRNFKYNGGDLGIAY